MSNLYREDNFGVGTQHVRLKSHHVVFPGFIDFHTPSPCVWPKSPFYCLLLLKFCMLNCVFLSSGLKSRLCLIHVWPISIFQYFPCHKSRPEPTFPGIRSRIRLSGKIYRVAPQSEICEALISYCTMSWVNIVGDAINRKFKMVVWGPPVLIGLMLWLNHYLVYVAWNMFLTTGI